MHVCMFMCHLKPVCDANFSIWAVLILSVPAARNSHIAAVDFVNEYKNRNINAASSGEISAFGECQLRLSGKLLSKENFVITIKIILIALINSIFICNRKDMTKIKSNDRKMFHF